MASDRSVIRRWIFLSLSASLLTLGLATASTAAQDRALFAGGCFWCMEEAFEAVPGVLSVVSGYTGGMRANPTYEQVSGGRTGHAESIEVVFDPGMVTYDELLDVFWHNVDPTSADGQFCDRGTQYRPAIFYHNEQQQRLAEASRQRIQRDKRFPEALVVEVTPASPFYVAEEHHQDYYKRNPIRYKYYKFACGRAQRLEELWGKKGG